MSARTPPLEVVVAGGGVAALELVLALNDLAADRVAITIVAPDVDFIYRPPSSADPSLLGYVERYPLRRLADDLGARLVPDALARVSMDRHEAVTSSGEVVPYDRLVLAVGARPYPAFRHAITLGVEDTTAALTRLVSDLDRGDVRRVAFVVQAARRGRCRSTNSRS
jgi:sulfide:quinone oxidoreductase